MATIIKVPRKNDFSYKAIIRQKGRVLKTKTFTRKSSAITWARRIEADTEALNAFGLPGAVMTFNELADKYMMQWTGKDHSRITQTKWWCDHIGNLKLTDITSHQIRSAWCFTWNYNLLAYCMFSSCCFRT
jgi:hypothetical protein